MIEMHLIEFGILLFLAFYGAFCLAYGLIFKIKEKKFTKAIIKGGVIPLDGGYQPTEKNTTQPPKTGSGVQPAPSKNAVVEYNCIIDMNNYPEIMNFFKEHDIQGQSFEFKRFNSKTVHKVCISPETAKKIFEKNNCSRLKMLLTPLSVTAEKYYAFGNNKESYMTLYHCPTCNSYIRKNRKRCFKCSQALDWEGVSENG